MEKDIKIVMEDKEAWPSETTVNELLNKALKEEISMQEFIVLISIISKVYENEKRKNSKDQI